MSVQNHQGLCVGIWGSHQGVERPNDPVFVGFVQDILQHSQWR